MTTLLSHLRRPAVVIAGLCLAAGTSPAEPTDDPTAPAPSSSSTPSDTPEVVAADVRTTLGTIDPCDLLDGDGVRRRYAEGPHTCEAQLGGTRVRVEVGVPIDDASTTDAESGEVAGLVALTAPDGCRLVFPVAPAHGISVSVDDPCDALPRAADVVGTALSAPDIDSRLRPPSPDAHTACGLVTDAVTEPDLLVDAAGDRLQGLDHCELDSGPVLARTGLAIDYSSTSFDEVARLLQGDRVEIAGQDAVVVEGETGCFVHTYLWGTEAQGRGTVSAEAVVRAADCQEARDVASVVIRTVGSEPAAPGSVAELVADSQP